MRHVSYHHIVVKVYATLLEILYCFILMLLHCFNITLLAFLVLSKYSAFETTIIIEWQSVSSVNLALWRLPVGVIGKPGFMMFTSWCHR